MPDCADNPGSKLAIAHKPFGLARMETRMDFVATHKDIAEVRTEVGIVEYLRVNEDACDQHLPDED